MKDNTSTLVYVLNLTIQLNSFSVRNISTPIGAIEMDLESVVEVVGVVSSPSFYVDFLKNDEILPHSNQHAIHS